MLFLKKIPFLVNNRRRFNAVIMLPLTLLAVSLFLHFHSAIVAPALNLKTKVLIENGGHNGFPDLIYWRDHFYLAFRAAKNHVDWHSSIKILRSSDAESWQPVAEMHLPDEDIRDPKFAVVHGQLFLYALRNKDITIMPYTTVFSTSQDGIYWAGWQDVSPKNWVFWRPKTKDGERWYVAADNRKGKESALFSSLDGIHWDKVSTIFSGEFSAETELTFLANGDLLATVRVEGFEGDPRTVIAHATAPYTDWQLISSHLTRLDGASSLLYDGKAFTVGRYERNNLFKAGNFFNQKRTSLFQLKSNELIWLSDLPSAGDTGYASALILNDKLYIAYYTTDPTKDYPWIIGQFQPTQIWLAQADLSGLAALAKLP